ncbi:hypothetical protein ACFFJI_11725 [Allobacillus sp. GCM10007491]
MKKSKSIIRHSWNAISGMVVLFLSLWMSGPGIGEANTQTYRLYFLILFILWVIGFLLQFKKRYRVIGIVITILLVMYYLVIFL